MIKIFNLFGAQPFVSLASSAVQSEFDEIGTAVFGIGGGFMYVASNGFVVNGLALKSVENLIASKLLTC